MRYVYDCIPQTSGIKYKVVIKCADDDTSILTSHARYKWTARWIAWRAARLYERRLCLEVHHGFISLGTNYWEFYEDDPIEEARWRRDR